MTVTAGDEDSWTFIYKKKNTKKNIEDGRMYVFGDLPETSRHLPIVVFFGMV